MILSTWDFQLSLLEISTSKYLALLTASSTCACSTHCPWGGHPHNLALGVVKLHMSRDMRFPKTWYLRPAKAQISLAHTCRLVRAFACVHAIHTALEEVTLITWHLEWLNSIWAVTWDFQKHGICDQQRLRSALRIRADWSEHLLVAWIFYDC